MPRLGAEEQDEHGDAHGDEHGDAGTRGLTGADLRMPLLGLLGWLGGVGATVLHPGVLAAVLLGVATLTAGAVVQARRRGRDVRDAVLTVTAAGAVVLVVAASVLLHRGAVERSPARALADQRAAVEVVGVVAGDPRPVHGRFADQVAVRLDVRRVVGRGLVHTLRTPVLVLADEEWADVQLGARVRTVGRLVPADGDDLAGMLSGASAPELVERPDAWWRGAERVRASIRASVEHRPSDQRALVPALVDGDDAGLDEELAADFATTGLTHLTAVSGTNLTLLVGFLLALARAARAGPRSRLVVAGLGIVGFVLLARTEPSVLRAAVMGTVGLLAMGSGGRQRALRSLGVATVVLLVLSPGLAVSAGFALSVMATAGIVVLGPGWRDAMVRWMPRWAAEAVAVPAAAQLACTPVVAAISGQVSVVAVGANLVVAPVVGPATVLGLAGGLVGLAGPFGAWAGTALGTGAALCVAWIVCVARRGADLPLAALEWGTGAWALVGLTLLCVVAAVVAPRLLRRPRSVALVVGLAVVAVLVRAPVGRALDRVRGWPDPAWVMAMCDVGQGDAIALRAGPTAAVVVDAGPDPDAVDGCLDRLGVTEVPLVVLTHFHADHVDGLPGVLEGRRVSEVWTTSLLDPPEAVRTISEESEDAGVPAHLVGPGGVRRVGEVSLQVLWPASGEPTTGPGDGSTANDASVVMVAEVGGVRVLLTGDVEPHGQEALARSYPGLDVDVLKVPHHGSRYQDADWLASLGADLALVSLGADNDYGHPAPETLDLVEGAGMEVGRTDLDGDLLVVPSAGGPRLEHR